jgi:hypothetical protein
VGLDRQVGLGRFLISFKKQKNCQANKGFLKNLLTPNKEEKNNLNLARIILNNFGAFSSHE